MFRKNVRANGRLFLFLPGTYGAPAGYQFLLDTAASAGYQVLGLEYVNATDKPGGAISDLCADASDPSCAARVRQERVYGDDASPLVDVSRANAIVNRVEKALAYLDREVPGEAWGKFLDQGRIVWSKVAVGGHSQGAGMAAFIAKRHEVARVCLFSIWDDSNQVTHGPAPWLLEQSATPANRYFALLHARESMARGSLEACKALGLVKFGAPVTMAADGTWPKGGGHVLTATLEPDPENTDRLSFGDAFHGSIAGDFVTPRTNNGRAAYRRAWLFVIGE